MACSRIFCFTLAWGRNHLHSAEVYFHNKALALVCYAYEQLQGGIEELPSLLGKSDAHAAANGIIADLVIYLWTHYFSCVNTVVLQISESPFVVPLWSFSFVEKCINIRSYYNHRFSTYRSLQWDWKQGDCAKNGAWRFAPDQAFCTNQSIGLKLM